MSRAWCAISTRTCRTAIALFLLFAAAGYAIDAAWIDIPHFLGLQQHLPSNLVDRTSAMYATNVRADQIGVLQKIAAVSSISTPSTFGTISNVTKAFDLDPLGADSPRLLFLAADITTPTTGTAGQHILATGLSDDGSGVTTAGAPTWTQVDSPYELAYDLGDLDGFVGSTRYNGLGFMSCDQGILELGGAHGAVAATNTLCATAAWVGSPSRPTASEGSAGLLVGTYQYRVTYVSALGESMPSKPSAPITVSSKHVSVAIPTGPTNICTDRRIYRTKGGTITLANPSFEDWTAGAPDNWTLSGAGATVVQTSDSTTVIQSCDSVGTAPANIIYGSITTAPCAADSSVKSEGSASARSPLPAWSSGSYGYAECYDRKTAAFYVSDIDAVYADFRMSSGAESASWVRFALAHSAGALYWEHPGPFTSGEWITLGGVAGSNVTPNYWYPTAIANTSYRFYLQSRHSPPVSGTQYSYLDNIRVVRDGAHLGTYGCKINRSGANAYLTGDAWGGTTYRNKAVTASAYVLVWGYTGHPVVTISLGETSGAAYTYTTSAVTLDTNWGWQELTVTRTIGAGATNQKIQINVTDNDGFVRVDNVVAAIGSGGTDGYFYVGSATNNTTGIYDDNIADSALTTAEDKTSRWYVPPGPWIAAHKERLWSCGQTGPTTQRNVLWFSETGLPEAWGGSNFIDMGGNDGDPVTGLAPARGSLYVLKRNSIWRLRGSQASDFDLEQVVSGIGCVDGRTVGVGDHGIVFYGKGTFWLFDGNSCMDIGEQVEGIVDDIYFDSDNDSFQLASVLSGDEFWFGYKTSDSTFPSAWLTYDAAQRRWTRSQWSVNPAWILWPSTRSQWMVGVSAAGAVSRLDAPGHDSTSTLRWITPAMSLSDPIMRGTLDWVKMSVESQWTSTANAYTLSLYDNPTNSELIDGGGSAYASKSFPVTTGLNQFEWFVGTDSSVISAGGNRFRRLSVGITENGQSDTTADRSTMPPPRVTGLYLQYRPEKRIP